MSTAAVYAQGEPIYRDVPKYAMEYYDACPTNPNRVCMSERRIVIGTTREFAGYKRGELITPSNTVTGIFRSKMQKDLYIRGNLISGGKYTVQID